MTERDIVVARRSGALRGPDGERIIIKQGRTIADADHPAVLAHPRAWARVNVALRTEGGETRPDADSFDPARAGADPDTIDQAEQFARLARAARDLGVLPDQPLTAAEVVDHVAAILDAWKVAGRPVTEGADPEPAPEFDDDDEEPALRPPREVVRQWAKRQGLAVGDKGRLADSVYAAYDEAHPQDPQG